MWCRESGFVNDPGLWDESNGILPNVPVKHDAQFDPCLSGTGYLVGRGPMT